MITKTYNNYINASILLKYYSSIIHLLPIIPNTVLIPVAII